MNNETNKKPAPKPALALSVQRAVRALGAPLRADIVRVMRATLQRDAQITLRMVGEDEGRALNHSYRHKDYATNVLSFVYETHPVVMGDLVICVPVVEREAQAQGKSLMAHYVHLMVHGVLHLHGYDHQQDDEADIMEQLEISIMADLGYADPYQDRECP